MLISKFIRRCLLIFPLLVLLPSSCSRNTEAVIDQQQTVVPAKPIKIVTWNLEWFPGKSTSASLEEKQEHMEQIRNAISEIDADVYLLQEVADMDSMEELFKDLPGYEIHIVSSFRYGNFIAKQQVAVVSRLPAISAFAESFVSTGGTRAPPRGFSFAALQTQDTNLLVYTVHLKANGGDPERNIRLREESARQIVKHVNDMLKQFPDSLVIVGGDFNLLLTQAGMEHERTLEIFKEAGFEWGWEGVPFEQRITWPSNGRYPDACFDMFVTKGVSGENRVLGGYEGLSDHLPVMLNLTFL
ncbi:endonuclease/exonuclease/phosphatase family protein [Kiritimatiellota bacterium B12222]|nr:endonuclease/exonuclease/phosphatase family protein [Kiritimatiellota bacterium B12222]